MIGNTLVHGKKIVSSAGTAVQVFDGVSAVMTIKALHGNSGMIYVGDDDVSSDNGFVLDSAEEVTIISHNDKDKIYIDAETTNDGVTFIGWIRLDN